MRASALAAEARSGTRAAIRSYFLFGLTQEQLSRTLFPIGGMLNADVRATGARVGAEDRREAGFTGSFRPNSRALRERPA